MREGGGSDGPWHRPGWELLTRSRPAGRCPSVGVAPAPGRRAVAGALGVRCGGLALCPSHLKCPQSAWGDWRSLASPPRHIPQHECRPTAELPPGSGVVAGGAVGGSPRDVRALPCLAPAGPRYRGLNQSDESWNYLSVEEKECLMFLEETIDSLNIEELEQSETVSTENGNQSEKLSPPHPENPHFPTAEPAGKFPRAVSPLSKDSIDSPSPQVVQMKSGSNTLPKYDLKPSSESVSSESSTGETRHRSLTTPADLLVESKDEKVKLGPPTAPKPGKLPPNIILRSSHKNLDLVSHPQSIFKASKDGLRSNGASKEGSSEGEAQQVRMEALAKLGLLSQTDRVRRNSSDTLKASNSQLGTGGSEKRTNHPEGEVQQDRFRGPKGPGVDANHSVASAAGPDVSIATDKPVRVAPGDADKLQWQLPATKSSSLKRFSVPGENVPPTSHYTAANIALNAGTSKTLPSVKRSINLNEGHVRNVSLPPWPLGSSKANSLRRFGSSGDNIQLASHSGLVPNTSITDAAGLNKQSKPRPMSICSEADLSARHGTPVEQLLPEKPAGKFFPIKIRHISAKPHKSPPKGINVQVLPHGPTSKDHKEALRKLGLLKE
ncbi:specifically androgen-regulated gene protein-like [Pristis pectinata]|uniref:specifically androgen-regulated gene protein-like n=1 Tax=Pristis pectinata TaxID=685728 RepID=UPI00223E1BD7|nr:specifically androgen-regulated gene protein-like [Pristis pectinata]